MKKTKGAVAVRILFSALAFSVAVAGCGKEDSAPSSGKTYSFSSSASARLSRYVPTSVFSASRGGRLPSGLTAPTLCSSVVCFDASTLTGKYYAVGLSIQAGGSGMLAYFGDGTPWSEITGTSTLNDFDSASPITNTGTLTCCGGTGDLSSSNTYIESVVYVFGYLDATFTVSGVTGNTSMNGSHTLRFILATGAFAQNGSTAQRGDVLYKDGSTFKWWDSSSNASDLSGLSATRPTSPVTLNSSVVNWTNPFGTEGNQIIPSLFAPLAAPSGGGLNTVTQAALETAGKTYAFGFNTTKFVMFPTLQNSGGDINQISSIKQLMSLVHLAGLPHSAQSLGAGSPADTVLTITP